MLKLKLTSPFNEYVTVRSLRQREDGRPGFLDDCPNIPAWRKLTRKGQLRIHVRAIILTIAHPTVGSQLIDMHGAVYLVTRVRRGGRQFACDVISSSDGIRPGPGGP